MKKSFQLIIGDYLDLEYKNITNKTILIFGKNDRQTPTYMAKRMKKLIKGSTLYFLQRTGHFCFVEEPDEFNSIVFNFLMEKSDD